VVRPTERWSLQLWESGDRPSIHDAARVLGTSVMNALTLIDDQLRALMSSNQSTALGKAEDARLAAVDARNLNSTTAVSTTPLTVTTGQQGVAGASVDLPANVGALAIAVFDVACDVRNGAGALEGRLGFIRLSDRADMGNASGPAIFAPSGAGERHTVAQVWGLGPVNYGRALQLRAVKSSTNVGLLVDSTTTKLAVTQLRSGVL